MLVFPITKVRNWLSTTGLLWAATLSGCLALTVHGGVVDNYLETQPTWLRSFPVDTLARKHPQFQHLKSTQWIRPLSGYRGLVNGFYYAIDGSFLDFNDTERYGSLPRAVAIAQDVGQSERPLLDALLVQSSDVKGEERWTRDLLGIMQHHLAAFIHLIPTVSHGDTPYPGEEEDQKLLALCDQHRDIPDLAKVCDDLETIRAEWLRHRDIHGMDWQAAKVFQRRFKGVYNAVNSRLMAQAAGLEPANFSDSEDSANNEPVAGGGMSYPVLKQRALDKLLKGAEEESIDLAGQTLFTLSYPWERHQSLGSPLVIQAQRLYKSFEGEFVANLANQIVALKEGEVLVVELSRANLSKGRQIYFARGDSEQILTFQSVQVEKEWWFPGLDKATFKDYATYPLLALQRAGLSLMGADGVPFPVIGTAWSDTHDFIKGLENRSFLNFLRAHKKDPYESYPLILKLVPRE